MGIRMDVLLNLICTEAVEGGVHACNDYDKPDSFGCHDYDKVNDLGITCPEGSFRKTQDNLPPIRYPSE